MARLTGKTAIITGGAAGIGLATARRFAAEGARLLLVDANGPALDAAVASLDGAATAYAGDVTRPEDAQGYVRAAVAAYGGVDVLVANAGIAGAIAPLPDYPVDVFARVMAVNVTGVFLTLKHGMPALAARGGGSVVITSSIAGLRGFAHAGAYVASKHAVIGLMRSAALEGAPLGIRVNSVNPAFLEGSLMRAIEEGFAPGAPDVARQGMVAMVPMARYGLFEEAADLMLFLASDESRYCTGGVYPVDGGMSAT